MCELTIRAFEEITCPSEQLGHSEAETLVKELALWSTMLLHSQTAHHSQLLFSTLQLGRRLIWLELESTDGTRVVSPNIPAAVNLGVFVNVSKIALSTVCAVERERDMRDTELSSC